MPQEMALTSHTQLLFPAGYDGSPIDMRVHNMDMVDRRPNALVAYFPSIVF
jgi:hypothetical protein